MKIGAIAEGLLERVLLWAGVVPTPMLDTLQAMLVARIIIVGVKLGVFEALQEGPLTEEEIASQLQIDRRPAGKLLQALAGIGYLRVSDGRFRLAPVARKWLLRDSPRSLHDSMLYRFLEWEVLDYFEDYVRSGEPLDVHRSLAPEQWGLYQRGMRSVSSLSADEVARRLPVPRQARQMLDIGGSHGFYSVALCRRHADLESTIIDLPAAVEHAAPLLEQEQMGQRVQHRAGNALEEEWGQECCEVVFMSQLVHHFTDEQNREVMQKAARALRPGGLVAILEVFRPRSPGEAGQSGAVLDFFFAVTSKSGCWSAEEIADWQRSAGLQPQAAIRLLTVPGAGIQVGRKQR